MRKLPFLLLFILFQCTPEKPRDIIVTKHWASLVSPDTYLRVNIASDKGGRLYYKLARVSARPEILLEWSNLGFKFEQATFDQNLEVTEQKPSILKQSYRLLHGKTSQASFDASRLRLTVLNKQKQQLYIDFHLTNDGLAFRYEAGSELGAELTVKQELSSFSLPANIPGWLQQYQEASKVSPAYEYFYEKVQSGSFHDGRATIRSIFNPLVEFTGLVIFGSDGWAMPALFRPVKNQYVLLTEADLDANYAGSHLNNEQGSRYNYRLNLPAEKEGLGFGDKYPTVKTPFKSPWRVAIAGTLEKIFASTMVTDLAPGPKGDFSYVKPGKTSWDWWSYLQTGGLKRQKQYVDAAAEFGWQYTLVDANWNKWPAAYDKLAELVTYAAEKNIGILLWYNSGGPNNRVTEEPRDLMFDREARRSEMKKLQELGIKGIKVDFWQSDKQVTVKHYLELIEDAHEFKLMVNLHGCTIPRGWRRTWPNLMTLEAVKGAEWYRFPVFRGPNSADNIYYTLTRNVIGPIDYTPVTFAAALEDQQISYGHSLALSVVLQSSLQHFADTADQPEAGYRRVFKDYGFVKDFLAQVPATFDESRLLKADPDSHLVVARRSGQTWYVAAISSKVVQTSFRLPRAITEGYIISSQVDKFVKKPLGRGRTSLSLSLAENDGAVMVFK